jgi:hypothetical protein
VPGDVQHAGDADVTDVERGVWRAIAAGHFAGDPANHIGIKFASRFCIAGHEFVPAEFAFC